MISSSLELIDIYGTNFGFTLFKSMKFKTVIGGVISLASIAIIITFSFLFGGDFFYRRNPKLTSKKVIPDSYPDPVKFTDLKTMFAWSFGDEFNTIDLSNILYTNIYYITYRRNETTKELMLEGKEMLNFKSCNQVMTDSVNLGRSYNLSQLYCLDFDDSHRFGGFYDSDLVHNIHMVINLCPNVTTYSEENGCTPYDTVKSLLSTYTEISFLTPSIILNPSDLDTPMTIFYEYYNYQLDFQSRKYDKFYFQDNVLIDDRGWIVEDEKQNNMHSIDTIKTDFYLVDQNAFLRNDAYIKLYEAEFYLGKNFMSHRRNFVKLQDFLAVIGGFTKFILMSAKFISDIFNYFERDNKIFHKVFDVTDDELEPRIAVCNANNNFLSSINPLNNHVVNPIGDGNNREIKMNSLFRLKMLCKIPSVYKTNKAQAFNYLKEYFNDKFDAIYYVKTLNKIDTILQTQFNECQLLTLQSQKKPNVFEIMKTSIKDKKQREKELVDYYKAELSKENFNKIDEFLMNTLKPRILQDILQMPVLD